MTPKSKNQLPPDDSFSLIPNHKLLALFATMIACRKLGETGRAASQSASSRKKHAFTRGHEAALVGAAIDIGPTDLFIAPLWPEPILKTINPSATIASALPTASSPSNGSHGVTLLFASKKQTSQAPLRKAMLRARQQNLPILLISLIRESEFQVADSLSIPPETNDAALPSICVDGTDVVAMYRVVSEAMTHARKGNGPTLIECLLYETSDPIQNMEQYLIRKGLLPPSPAPSPTA